MTLLIAEDSSALSQLASNWVQQKTFEQDARSAFLPAGKTPEGLYQLWEHEQPAWLKALSLLQIDDVLTGPERGVFRRFFETRLPSYRSQFQWIDQADHGADIGVLGLGLNGHIAFHEPELPLRFFSGCVRLSPTTCKTLNLENGTWGITYGAEAFLRCKSLLMIASGESKRAVVARLLAQDQNLPASALLQHKDFTLIVDRAAYP